MIRTLRLKADTLGARDADETAALVAATFLEGEPMARTLLEEARRKGERAERAFRSCFSAFVGETCAESAKGGVSIIVRDGGRIVGFSLNEIAAPDGGAPMPPPCVTPVFELLAGLQASYFSSRPAQAFHVFMIGAAPDLAGRGIASMAVRESVAVARVIGLGAAFTEATSGSQGLFAKLGFRTLSTAPYATSSAFVGMTAAEEQWLAEEAGRRPWPDAAALMELTLS